MNFLKHTLLCSLICTVMPSKATYVYVSPSSVEALAAQMSLSTAKVILATTIAFIAGGILGSEEKTIAINREFNEFVPEGEEFIQRNLSNRTLAITGAVSLGLISVIACVDENSHPLAKWLIQISGASTIISFTIASALAAARAMGYNVE